MDIDVEDALQYLVGQTVHCAREGGALGVAGYWVCSRVAMDLWHCDTTSGEKIQVAVRSR